jgi:hypothetical protein
MRLAVDETAESLAGAEIRRALLPSFPYAIVYAPLADEIRVNLGRAHRNTRGGPSGLANRLMLRSRTALRALRVASGVDPRCNVCVSSLAHDSPSLS